MGPAEGTQIITVLKDSGRFDDIKDKNTGINKITKTSPIQMLRFCGLSKMLPSNRLVSRQQAISSACRSWPNRANCFSRSMPCLEQRPAITGPFASQMQPRCKQSTAKSPSRPGSRIFFVAAVQAAFRLFYVVAVFSWSNSVCRFSVSNRAGFGRRKITGFK